jgi:hypothetical protein
MLTAEALRNRFSHQVPVIRSHLATVKLLDVIGKTTTPDGTTCSWTNSMLLGLRKSTEARLARYKLPKCKNILSATKATFTDVCPLASSFNRCDCCIQHRHQAIVECILMSRPKHCRYLGTLCTSKFTKTAHGV